MNEPEFRRLQISDLDSFIVLRLEQMREEGAASPESLSDALRDYYEKSLADGSFVSWIACVNGRIVATSGVSFVRKPPYPSNPTGKIGLISGMYTLPEYRRQGIASKLLRLISEEAKRNCCGLLEVTSSDAGVSLYTSFGFSSDTHVMQYKL